MNRTGYYVDESGKVYDITDARDGFTLAFHDVNDHTEVWLVTDEGEVHHEVVLWPSLEAMSLAGIDISARPKTKPPA